MKRIFSLIALITVSVFIAACGGPANNTIVNTTVNTNANTTKPNTTAPTADAFLDLEKKASEAYAKGDGTYFETFLSDKFVMSMGKDRMGKAAIVAMIKTAKCELKDGVKLSEQQISKINDDTYVSTHRNDSVGTCTENGKSMDMKPTRASTVWVRSGDKWQAVWHGENEIIGAPTADKKDDKTASSEPKKDNKTAPAPKKDEVAKTDKPVSNSNVAPTDAAKLVPSANTDALSKIHAANWEAFRNKDAKAFEGMLASPFGFVGPDGSYLGSKADAIKEWTGGGKMKCEGITKTSFTSGFAQAISPTVEVLLGKGNADGKCDGQPIGDLWTAAVYLKEGDTWKLAYMMESLPPA